LQNLNSFLRRQYKELLAAVRFLSVIPMPGEKYVFARVRDESDVVIGCEYFPLVGLVLALLLWLLLLVSNAVPQLLIAAILVGAFFHQGVTTRRTLVTTICTLLIVLLTGQLAGLLSLIVVLVVTLVLGYSVTRSIGGLTGDTYGAIAEITEVVALLAMIVVVRI